MSSTQGQKDGRDKYSLRGRVFQSIREDILSGRYEQNTELKEAAIGAELGVSRTPVREALRQLELEGLVTIIPNRGAYVNMITAKDVQDIYVDPFHAGRIMCQMGNPVYYGRTVGFYGRNAVSVGIPYQ